MFDRLTDAFDRVHEAARDRLDIARYWVRNAGRIQPPIEMVRFDAFVELRRNPTITTYKLKDGVEVRRPGDPFARLNAMVQRMHQAVAAMFGAP